jgi:hypothetical protein
MSWNSLGLQFARLSRRLNRDVGNLEPMPFPDLPAPEDRRNNWKADRVFAMSPSRRFAT